MRVLVTGATGFVGRHVVPAIAERGHTIRALVRSVAQTSAPDAEPHSSAPGSAGGYSNLELAKGDLLQPKTLPPALYGVDTVVHLAIGVTRDREILLQETIQGTKNLCEAMVTAGVTRIVHCSSRAVYDWELATQTPDESAPMDRAPQLRDEYAQAKIAQEKLINEHAARHHWIVTILRPGFIWGPGREELAGWGHSLGPLHLVVAPGRRLPMTYIENCAECFALAVDHPNTAGQIFNIIDDDLPTARQFAELQLKRARQGGAFINLPYGPGMLFAKFATGVNRTLLGGRLRLPGLFVPSSYRARFHPLHLSNDKAKQLLGWCPRYGFQEAWQRSRTVQTESAAAQSQSGPLPQEAPHGR